MAILPVLTPGADFAIIVRNTVVGGRRYGIATTVSISTAAAAQGLLVSVNIASVIVHVQPVFLAIKWAGITYLARIAIGYQRTRTSWIQRPARGHDLSRRQPICHV